MRAIVLAVVLIGLVAVPLVASQATTQPSAPAKADVNQLAWMRGAWVTEHGGMRVEEHWTPPRAGTMMAVGRTMRGERTVFYEFLRIEQTSDGGLTYHAAPKGRSPATPFKAVEVTADRIVFENPQHDFPTRITYWKEGADGMGARVEGKDGKGAESWTYKRAAAE